MWRKKTQKPENVIYEVCGFFELWIGSTDLNINSYVKIPYGALMFGEPCISTTDNVKLKSQGRQVTCFGTDVNKTMVKYVSCAKTCTIGSAKESVQLDVPTVQKTACVITL